MGADISIKRKREAAMTDYREEDGPTLADIAKVLAIIFVVIAVAWVWAC